MPIWRNVIKSAFRALLPVLVVPGLLTALIIRHFGLTSDAVLIIVMIAQFYIIWLQVEVSLRQTKISELTYEPILTSEIRTTSSVSNVLISEIILKNAGEYPAYNVFTSISITPLLDLEGTDKLVGTLAKQDKIIATLPQGSEMTLYTLSQEEILENDEFEIDVNYTNVLGAFRNLTFKYVQKFGRQPMTIQVTVRSPGILINSIEDLHLIYGLFFMDRRIRKLKKRSSKLSGAHAN